MSKYKTKTMILTSTIPKPYLLKNLRCFSAISTHLTHGSWRSQLRGQCGLRECLNPGVKLLQNGPISYGLGMTRLFSTSTRNFSNQDEPQMPRRSTRSLPPLMDFDEITWPSILKTIKNFIFVHFIIRPYFDRDFTLQDFIDGSKHAMSVRNLNLFCLSRWH